VRERERKSDSVCVCARESVCVRERQTVWVRVCEREIEREGERWGREAHVGGERRGGGRA